MPVAPGTPDELDRLSALIDRWAERELAENPVVKAVDRDPDERRWYVRMAGEEKQTFTVWLTLREYTLHYESYFMPGPEENAQELWEYLLRLNNRLFAMRFALGQEDAVYLVGQFPVRAVDEAELDRVVGSVYAYTEQYFRPAMRIGYTSKFTG
ncbi:MAG TPA: YbjN domain-containing protein [Acidimicrobiales bacterium]|nr:YbjN domain-containing protein [Acidimicrobiales bacterium]